MKTKEVNSVTIAPVLACYGLTLQNCKVSSLGNGLINLTYLVKSPQKTFVLQKVNKSVFKNPEQVVKNAELIHTHLHAREKNGQYLLQSIGQVMDSNNRTIVEVDNQYWRAIQFIPGCYTVESVADVKQAMQVANAFALFSAALSDFPASQLTTIIPDFHNLTWRLQQLNSAIEKDPVGRLDSCSSLVELCLQQSTFINEVDDLVPSLPVHVTHNDTKINNLLFSKHNHKPVAVIDLDTCMQGFLMNDFGDMVRTCCTNLSEDDSNIGAMQLRMDIFDGLARAYIDAFNGQITHIEKQSLIIGAQLLPFLMGVRFLTDYINGDHYFHVSHEKHNMHRAANQFQLYKLLHGQQKHLTDVIMR